MRGLFRMIVMLDRRLKQLAEEEVIDLSNSLAYYVLDASSATSVSISVISLWYTILSTSQYYVFLPFLPYFSTFSTQNTGRNLHFLFYFIFLAKSFLMPYFL